MPWARALSTSFRLVIATAVYILSVELTQLDRSTSVEIIVSIPPNVIMILNVSN